METLVPIEKVIERIKSLFTINFKSVPLGELLWQIEDEALQWCEGKCFYFNMCFSRQTFRWDNIETCQKLPKVYKLFWKARADNALFTRKVDDQAKKRRT